MSVPAQAGEFVAPFLDYHALAPLMVVAGGALLVLIVDLFLPERSSWVLSPLSGIVLLAAAVPVLTLALDGTPRVLFGGAFVVDTFALTFMALFLLAGYVVVLLSSNYIAEGDYHLGEYYVLLLASITGMVAMASARDLISIFVALELLSIPGYMLASWRKRDQTSNEAGLKYYLLGVFASAVLLYGMSLLYGLTGTTVLVDIAASLSAGDTSLPIVTLAIVFVLVGFGFKVSAVPFHQWAPDTYEGAPTPITAFLSVASKAAGFVALLALLVVGVGFDTDLTAPLFWILSAASMTVGNLVALRQTNIVRMLAYSSVAQGGFVLAPLAVLGSSPEASRSALTAVVTYLLIYAAMNLGAFAVVLAVARKTHSGEISSYGGLWTYAPGLTVLMSIFLFALAGIPPLGGWVAKFAMFSALLDAGGAWAVALALVAAVNSVIALFYYANVAREMWMRPVPDGDTTRIDVPSSLRIALGLCAGVTLVVGVLPNLVLRFGDLATFAIGG